MNASYWDSGAIGGGVYCGTGGDGGDGGDGGHGGDAVGGSLWAAGSPAITDNTFSGDSVAAGQAPADCANSPFTLGCGGVGGTAGPGGQDGSDGMDGSGGSSAGVDQYTTTVTPVSVAAGPLPDGALGVPYSSSIGISGGSGPFTWSQAGGQLPPGLTLGATTGQISGSPTSYGTFTFGIEVVDEGNPQGVPPTADLAITIPPPPPEITTTSLPAGAVGVAYYQTLAAIDGTAPYTWSITSGSLPAGLTLDPAAGAITGTPTSVGASTFTVEVTDSSSPALTDSASLTIEVTPPPPQISTVELAEAQKGTAYTAKLAATGGTTPYRWSIASGSLPPGLSLSATKGKITGTPTTLGTFGFDVQVTDSTSPTLTATAGLSITVTKDDLTITTVSLPTGTKGSPYSAPVVASGGYAPYTWELLPGDGALPGGLHLNPSTGVISGTPTAKGSFRFAVAVTDQKRYYVPEYFTIVVAKPA